MIDSRVNNRVFEEAACAAYLFRVRQLTVADRDHCVGKEASLLGGRQRAGGWESSSQSLVGEVGGKREGESETDAVDEIAVSPFALEARPAVGKLAIGGGNPKLVARADFKAVDTIDNILSLRAVSSDVLDRSGADGARDAGKVFETVPAVGDTGVDEVGPYLAGGGLDDARAVVFFDERDALVDGVDDGAFVAVAEDHVAAATEDEKETAIRGQLRSHGAEVGGGFEGHETGGGGVDGEGVIML